MWPVVGDERHNVGVISHDDHLARILAAAPAPRVERLAVSGGSLLGRVLAADVRSAVELPAFTNSAMDGYAVHSADVNEPCELPVVGDIAAGDTRSPSCEPGSTWRIMTGAPMPEGADAVVPVELTDGGVERVRFEAAATPGNHIRHAGEDVRVGDLLLPRGTHVAPHHVAVLASSGVTQVDVVARPRVVVVSTGDELRAAGSELAHGQIHDSNGPMLAALVEAAGAQLVEQAHLPDDARAVSDLLERVVESADVVITTGGVSAGAFDVVKEALIEAGDVTFDKVAMQPGKPQGFGLLGERRVPVFTLPGNPMSTLVSFHVFVLPTLDAMGGRPPRECERAVVERGWTSPPGRAQFARVAVRRDDSGRLVIHPNSRQGSHHLGELAEANALALVPADVDVVQADDELDIQMLLTKE